jgi:hypothetical protein
MNNTEITPKNFFPIWRPAKRNLPTGQAKQGPAGHLSLAHLETLLKP